MRPTFEEIYENAIDRKGEETLEERFPEVKSSEELKKVPDDRYLAAMARSAFSAGFKHWIVDAMWDGFEEVFHGFDPEVVAEFDNDRILELGERGTHLGGNTGPRSLRHAGRDTFILTRDVTYALRLLARHARGVLTSVAPRRRILR